VYLRSFVICMHLASAQGNPLSMNDCEACRVHMECNLKRIINMYEVLSEEGISERGSLKQSKRQSS
jgi:hypothetical protein